MGTDWLVAARAQAESRDQTATATYAAAFSLGAARTRLVVVTVAVVVAVGQGLLLSHWLVDDAGISFAYARNLAVGNGLVSQPGVMPVEGFSNPLWTLLLVPFFAVGAFDPAWTPKTISLVLIVASFATIVWRAHGRGLRLWLAACPPILLALDSSFMIWTTSGLENPLLAALLVLSAVLAMRVQSRKPDLSAGVVAGLLALTRPDALMYAAAYPMVLLWAHTPRSRLVSRLWRYASAFLLTFGSYVLARRLYFEDWLPNTFHAKVRPWMLTLEPSRVWELAGAATGRWIWVGVLLAVLTASRALLRRRMSLRGFVLLVHLSLASAAYLALPADWMGEYRFATGFFIFLYWMIGEAAAAIWATRPGIRGVSAQRSAEQLGARRACWRGLSSRMRWFAPASLVLLLAESTFVHVARTTAFAAAPTVPLARITMFARAYDHLAASIGPGPHSLLTPDLGGMLFHEGHALQVYDLAGLCDRTIARTLMGHPEEFHDYVFATIRPTFIHVHGAWADWASLHQDPRLERDYVPLGETWSGSSGKGEPLSGDYVRRESIEAVSMERLRTAFLTLGLDRPLP